MTGVRARVSYTKVSYTGEGWNGGNIDSLKVPVNCSDPDLDHLPVEQSPEVAPPVSRSLASANEARSASCSIPIKCLSSRLHTTGHVPTPANGSRTRVALGRACFNQTLYELLRFLNCVEDFSIYQLF